MIQKIALLILGIGLMVGGFYWAENYSSEKSKAVYEKFARDLSSGNIQAAYDVLHPNAQRGIPFAQFKAAFGRLQPIVTISMHPESTIDKMFGKTFSVQGCESEYTMKAVDYVGEILITRFNFKPFCGY